MKVIYRGVLIVLAILSSCTTPKKTTIMEGSTEMENSRISWHMLEGKNPYGKDLLNHKEVFIESIPKLLGKEDLVLDYSEKSLRAIDMCFYEKRLTEEYVSELLMPLTLYLGESLVRLFPEKEWRVEMVLELDIDGELLDGIETWAPYLKSPSGPDEMLFVEISKELEDNVYSEDPDCWIGSPMIGTLFILTTESFLKAAPSPSRDKEFTHDIYIDED